MSIAAVLRELMNAGLQGEALVSAVARVEDAQKIEKGAARAARNKRYYEKNKTIKASYTSETSETSQDAGPAAPLDAPPLPPAPPSPPLNPPTTPETPSEAKASSAPKGARTRGCRIPDDFVSSDEALAVCAEMGLHDGEASEALAEFRDFWVGVPGVKGTKLDWPATLRNRLREVGRRKPQARASPSGGGRSNPYHEVAFEALERTHGTGSDDRGFRPRLIAGSR